MSNISKRLSISLWLLALVFSSPSIGNESTPVELSIGSIRTAAEQAAVGLAIKYKEKVDDEYFVTNANRINESSGKGWLLSIAPEVEIQTGEADSFNGVTAKLTGNYLRFRMVEVAGINTPDTEKPFTAYPISLGLESNRNFERNSLLLEVGYVPFSLTSRWQIGIQTNFAVFLQAGYKFETDETPADVEGGAVDESKEEPDSELLRLKLDVSTKLLKYNLSDGRYQISLIPRVRAWYDIANSETYHKIEAELSISLGDGKTFDFRYEDGSGAPNFNEGSQFGTFLTVNF